MKIYIDADGCPVIGITIKLAKKYVIPCVAVCDTSHTFSLDGAEIITVSKGSDSADFKIVNLISKGDIVITQDYGLAAMCLAKEAVALNQNGLQYTVDNIESLLFSRHNAKKIRRSGGRLKGMPKRTPLEDEMFEKSLDEILREHNV